MFREEKIFVLDNTERCIKLSDSDRMVALIFINKDRIIIKGELEAVDSSIQPPEIKNL